MNNKKNKIIFGLIFVFLLYALLSFFYNDLYLIRYKKMKLKQGFNITNTGKIVSCSKRVKKYNEYNIIFSYVLNGHVYTKTQYSSYNFKVGYQDYLLKMNFNIVYDLRDYTNACLLISQKDFNNFDIAFPDSLHRINERLLN